MKKFSLALFAFCLLGACAAHTSAARRTLTPADMPFIAHSGPGAFNNVLAQNLPYEPFLKLRGLLETHFGKSLAYYKGWSPSGEAHVTVITPVEYWQVLRPYLTIEEINQIARKHHIQAAKITLLGMGCGQLEINGKTEETYFVIVRSPKLLKVRQAVYKEFIRRGGNAKDFDPAAFYPHVTVAYTLRDLHIQDGVKKDMPHSHAPELDPLLKQAF